MDRTQSLTKPQNGWANTTIKEFIDNIVPITVLSNPFYCKMTTIKGV